jgi:Trk K+ transport system NAD-binding subunit
VRSTLIRVVLAVLVYALGVWALATVPTTAGPPTSPLVALYQGLRFFVLDPWGMPTGGPATARVAFWLALFGAPAVVAESAVGLLRAVHARLGLSRLTSRRLDDPVVIVCGFGLHGRTIAVAAREAGCTVIAVDHEDISDGRGFVLAGAHRIQFVSGEFTSESVLDRAGIRRARAVWFCAGDPMLNLRGAQVASRSIAVPDGCEIVPLVDEDWDLGVTKAWVDACKPRIVPFVQYTEAADALLTSDPEDLFTRRVKNAMSPRIGVLGFGRFAIAVLGRLAQYEFAPGARPRILVVDPRASAKCESWKRAHGAGMLELVPVDALAEEWTWATNEPPDAVIVCTASDHANLRIAGRIQRLDASTVIVLRMFDPEMTEFVNSTSAIHAKSLAQLTEKGIAPRIAAYVEHPNPDRP